MNASVTLLDDNLFGKYLAGLLTFVIPCIGIVVNLLASYLLYNIHSLRGSFAFICISHSLSQTGILAFLGFWSAPMIMLSSHPHWSLLNRKIGHLLLILWYSVLYTQILISFNRFCIIVMPMTFKRIFTNQKTLVMIACVWIVSLLHSIVYLFPGCDYAFNTEQYYWEYEDTACGRFLTFYLDYLHGTIICAIVLSLDLVSLVTLHTTDNRSAGYVNNDELKRRQKRDLVFFVQACTISIIYALGLLCWHFFSKFATTKWEVFACTTLVWCLAHTLDGCVILTFNSELRHILFRPKQWLSLSEHSSTFGSGPTKGCSTTKRNLSARNTVAVISST